LLSLERYRLSDTSRFTLQTIVVLAEWWTNALERSACRLWSGNNWSIARLCKYC